MFSNEKKMYDPYINQLCMCMLTESGVGAGIDSYYEYVLKAYILLGDDTYLERFNKVIHVF